MNHDNLVLRTIYIDPELDDALMRQARSDNVGKAELFRHYLRLGIKTVRSSANAPPMDLAKVVLVLRTIFIDPALDDLLRVEAFDARLPKNDLIRYYLSIGMTA